jgi:hypothetical protein
MTDVREWYDWRGNTFTAPADARTCYDTTGKWRTHLLLVPRTTSTMQALTRCGRRAGPIPGGGEADCPDCVEA